MSVSKYSANPAHTPAIFLPARMRRSRLGESVADAPPDSADAEPVWPSPAEESTPVGLPHEIQYRAESSRCAPHCVQYIADSIKARMAALFRDPGAGSCRR